MDTHVPPDDPSIPYRRPNAQTSTALSVPASPPPPSLPPISDYWPDAPQRRNARTSPHPQSYKDEPRRTLPAPPAATKRRRLRLPLGLIVAAVLLAGIGVVGARLVQRPASQSSTDEAASPTTQPAAAPPSAAAEPTAPASFLASPSASPTIPTDRTSISAPVNGRTAATFELVSDATTVNLRAASLGADLYRIATPKGSGVLPRVAANGTGIRLSLTQPDKGEDTTVDIVLNSRIRWNLVMTGGARTSVLNLAATTVGKVDLDGGATRIDLTLPRPNGTTPVRMTGGANQFQIRTVGAVPARLRIRKGAGKVVFDGRTDNGVDRGAVFTSAKFADSDDRIDVDAVGGVGTLTFGAA